MLPPRIEQEAGAGFDDAAYVLSMEKLLCFAKLPRVRFVWVERVMIECQRYALVTKIGENLQRVRQSMVGKAIGVVTEVHDRRPVAEKTALPLRDDCHYKPGTVLIRSLR